MSGMTIVRKTTIVTIVVIPIVTFAYLSRIIPRRKINLISTFRMDDKGSQGEDADDEGGQCILELFSSQTHLITRVGMM